MQNTSAAIKCLTVISSYDFSALICASYIYKGGKNYHACWTIKNLQEVYIIVYSPCSGHISAVGMGKQQCPPSWSMMLWVTSAESSFIAHSLRAGMSKVPELFLISLETVPSLAFQQCTRKWDGLGTRLFSHACIDDST